MYKHHPQNHWWIATFNIWIEQRLGHKVVLLELKTKGVQEMVKRGNSEGTIFRKSNGKWRAQVSIDGRRLSITADTRAECRDWLRKKLNQIDRGIKFKGQSLTLANISKSGSQLRNALRPKTAFQYEQLITLHLEPMMGKVSSKT